MFSLPSSSNQVIEKANALLGIRHDLLNQLGSLERQVQDLPQAVLGRAFGENCKFRTPKVRVVDNLLYTWLL